MREYSATRLPARKGAGASCRCCDRRAAAAIVASGGSEYVILAPLIGLLIIVGPFTPPFTVNLTVSCRIADEPMEATVRWIAPPIVAKLVVLPAVIVLPDLALWLPWVLGY